MLGQGEEMNTMWRSFVLVICFCALLRANVAWGSDGVYVVSTKPTLAFGDGYSTYMLGQSMSNFLSSFGPAENVEVDTYSGLNAENLTREEYSKRYLAYTKSHYYVNDGIIITEDKAGKIKGVIFYVIGDAKIKSANVRTQQGISRGASLRKIVKTYGSPFKVTEYELLGFKDMHVYYRFGNDVLSFGFKDGILETISMNANYLPFLKLK
ncbi:MAG: hypothetical protein LUQ65_08645 [Candidatus Helarchaeota archaeon]|nr:hypothetical protein [Candidatus Helarchaeota archaeon]